jgi:hypothetical protein
MTQTQKVTPTKRVIKAKVVDPLDRIRAAAQDLHGAISDAIAKSEDTVKADWKENLAKAKAVSESIQSSLALHDKMTKGHLHEAFTFLAATQKHIEESLKHTGRAFQRSVRHSLSDAHAAAEKVSEAVAAKRGAKAKHTHK